MTMTIQPTPTQLLQLSLGSLLQTRIFLKLFDITEI